jgi:hypothetical protein
VPCTSAAIQSRPGGWVPATAGSQFPFRTTRDGSRSQSRSRQSRSGWTPLASSTLPHYCAEKRVGLPRHFQGHCQVNRLRKKWGLMMLACRGLSYLLEARILMPYRASVAAQTSEVSGNNRPIQRDELRLDASLPRPARVAATRRVRLRVVSLRDPGRGPTNLAAWGRFECPDLRRDDRTGEQGTNL